MNKRRKRPTQSVLALPDGESNPLDPPGRWLARQFIDSTNGAREAEHYPAEVSTERCAELAGTQQLDIADWIELTGIGNGWWRSYGISSEGVRFRKWDKQALEGAPTDWQIAMERDNKSAPLEFPCTPTDLLQFIDTALGKPGFCVPNAFRSAVVEQSQALTSDRNQVVEPARCLNEAPVAVPDGSNQAQEPIGASPSAPSKPKATLRSKGSKWSDTELTELLERSILPGATQKSLADYYGVSRPRISMLLKQWRCRLRPIASSQLAAQLSQPRIVKARRH